MPERAGERAPAACREIFKEVGRDPDLPFNCFEYREPSASEKLSRT